MRGFGWDVTVTEVARAAVRGRRGAGAPARPHADVRGHVDVVTEGDPAGWSFDPFGGDVVDGRLRGRGSADMKSGVAAMIHAARAVELGGFRRPIVVGVLADEEGMMLGAKRFAADLDAGRYPGWTGGIDGVIVCEPEGGEVCPVAKGAIRLTVAFHGAMAHGAMPKMGRKPVARRGLAADRVAGGGAAGYQAQVGAHDIAGRLLAHPDGARRPARPTRSTSSRPAPCWPSTSAPCPGRPPGADRPDHPAWRQRIAAE